MAGNPVPQRVLVIDDMDEVRTLIRRILSEGGYEVDVAATLAEARGCTHADTTWCLWTPIWALNGAST